MFQRFTEKARRVIFFARYEAAQFGSPYIETEHLLLGVLREDEALTNRFIGKSSWDIRKEIEANTTVHEKTSTSADLPLRDESKRVLNFSAEEADRLKRQAHWHGAFAAWPATRKEMLCGQVARGSECEAGCGARTVTPDAS